MKRIWIVQKANECVNRWVLRIIARLRFRDLARSMSFISSFGPCLLVAGCAAPSLPEQPPQPAYVLTIDDAVAAAVNDLLVQIRRLPEFSPSQKSTAGDLAPTPAKA